VSEFESARGIALEDSPQSPARGQAMRQAMRQPHVNFAVMDIHLSHNSRITGLSQLAWWNKWR
jgi:hypothetical protein